MIRLYNILVIFFILSGCACWFATFLDNEIKGVICVIMLFLWNKISSNTLNSIPYHLLCGVILLGIVQLFSTRFDIISSSFSTIMILTVCTPMLLSYQQKKELLNTINVVFYYLVFASLVLHICKMLGLLPNVEMFERGHYIYQNYILYLYSPNYEFKCCGFCWEPGFFSLLLSALLLINGYDFKKKQCKLYFLALFLTFSLGGYLLTIIGLFIFRLITAKISFINLLVKLFWFITILVVFYYIITFFWNGGNNIINELVLQKLLNTYSESSIFESRQSSDALFLWNQIINSDAKWFGLGYKQYDALRNQAAYYDAASISQFILINGIIGTILHIFAISYLCFKSMNPRYAILGFSFLLLDFLQHGYGVMSSMFLLILLWISYMNKKSKLCIK